MFEKEILLLAQINVQTEPNIEAVENAAFVFNGPQFFAALLAGVVLAFAFQLLFTNLGVAIGISMVGGRGSSESPSSSSHSSQGFGSSIKKIGLMVGLGTLVSVTLALFIASLLAVKLGLFASPLSGAIVGLVIWAAFFGLMMFLSSQAIGSLLGSVANTATSGIQMIFGTATAALGAGAVNKQVVNTAEAAANAVKKELGMAIDPVSMRENIEDLLHSVQSTQLDVDKIARDFEDLLNEENLQEVADSDSVRNIDRQTFVQLISDRSDISKQDAERIAGRLESVWRKKTHKSTHSSNPISDFTNYLKSANKEQLVGQDFDDKLNSLLNFASNKNSQDSSPGTSPLGQMTASFGVSSLANIVMGRADLSDFDVEKIINQLKTATAKLSEGTDKVATQVGIKEAPNTTIKKDIENYLTNAYPWQLQPHNLQREFRDLIYDVDADPEAVAVELRQVNRAYSTQILKQKGLLSQLQIRNIANILDAIRLEVIIAAEAAQARAKSIELMAEVEDYLATVPKGDLTPEKIQLGFKPILEDSDATAEQLSTRLAVLDRPTLERMLELRNDMDVIEASAIAGELEIARNQVLAANLQNANQAQALAEKQWLQLQTYLRETRRGELYPDGIKRELKLLLDDSQTDGSVFKVRLALFDRDVLVQLLSQRRDLTVEQIDDTVDIIEDSWLQVVNTPKKLASKAQAQYDSATSAIADYLRRTGKPELNPRGIEQDLTLLFNNPKLGSRAVRQRLAAMDRDTLVQLLAQRQDLSQEDANQIINDVQSTLKNIAKAPRRAAIRTQEKVHDFQNAIADYLRSTDKAELSPTGIKRDVELLLNDPRAGVESLKTRLASFDRSTLVALLSQREDIDESDVNRVVDQILEVRDSVMSQLQMVQDKIQSVMDRILAKIKNYLNSLDRPELAYEGIKRDINVLFNDPQAGFTALKDRFSHLDRDTLIAIMSSRDDISQADAERIVSQIERTRDRALQRAERIQTEAAMRLESAKRQAAEQVEETRQAAATASWWLFVTALISAIASASAGALGV
ncbi:MAG: MFS transporter, partial [Waterburya sp.]